MSSTVLGKRSWKHSKYGQLALASRRLEKRKGRRKRDNDSTFNKNPDTSGSASGKLRLI